MNQTISSVTCLGCGCACDDIEVMVEAGRITETRRACELGAAWFAQGAATSPCQVAGRPAPASAALEAAAVLLRESASPLIYLAPQLSCDAQREAAALADALGAAIDSVSSSPAALASLLAAQEEGGLSATLGEVRNRADVLVFWGTDPTATHPRFRSRYAPDHGGRYVPDGRRSRKVVAVDIGERRAAPDADVRLSIASGNEGTTLSFAAAAIDGPVANGPADAAIPESAAQLVSSLSGARYVAVIVDGDSLHQPGAGVAHALVKLVRALNGVTRAALVTLRGGGNRCGADAVLTWQTGFPLAVDFARGFPEYRPYDGTAAERLTRHRADAVLVAGAPARLAPDVRALLLSVPCAIIGPLDGAPEVSRARVAIDTGIAGIHEGGLAYRMDNVPVRLQEVLGGRPVATTLLRDLRQRCLS